jgi:hypothetical protein
MTRVGKAWLGLTGLTAATLGVVFFAGHHLTQAVLAFIVFAVAGAKAWLILTRFVGINAGGWRTIFLVYLLVLCAALAVLSALDCGQAGFQCVSGI